MDGEDGQVVGWIAISPTSSRPVYRGCVEVRVYIDEAYRGKGIGTRLLKTLIDEAREVGYRERIARDRFGNWQNTTIMEYRM